MIRFHLERMNKGSVHLRCFHGWVQRDGDSLQDLLPVPGEFGMGNDAREKCLRTAEVLMLLSCEREPVVARFAPQFCDEIIREILSRTCHISSEDVREWLFDAIGSELAGRPLDGAHTLHFTGEGADVESN